MDAFHNLKEAIKVADVSGIDQAANILCESSAQMDGAIIQLIVPSFIHGKLWNFGNVEGEIAITNLIKLLRISIVRHAIRSKDRPGMVYSEMKSYRNMLEKCVKKIIKTDKKLQEVDLHAELRASWAILVSIKDERNIWDHLKQVAPKLAFLAGLTDPIRYAGPLMRGLFEIGEMAYDQYQDFRSLSLAKQTINLTSAYLARHYMEQSDIDIFKAIYDKCDRWNTIVLLIRLISTIIEERYTSIEIQSELIDILIKLSGFEKFVFRNNWKVRRSALFHLFKLRETAQEKSLHPVITGAIELRVLFERDPNVIEMTKIEPMLKESLMRLKEPRYQNKPERELETIKKHMETMMDSLHEKDEARVDKMLNEIQSVAENARHCKTLDLQRSKSIKYNCETVTILEKRSQAMSNIMSDVVQMMSQPKPPREPPSSPDIRLLPQRNLEGNRFIGRVDELEKLTSIFGQKPAKVFIIGEPGIGKSTLALKFAYEAEKRKMFTNFVWVKSEKSSTIFEDYLTVAHDMKVSHGDDAAKVKYVKSHLKAESDTLLIYDNADFADQQNDEEIDKFVNSHFLFGAASVLVTTRSSNWSNYIGLHIELVSLSDEDSLNFLMRFGGIMQSDITPEDIRMLEGNPLTLQTAGKYLQQSGSVEGLRRKMKEKTQSETSMNKLVEVCLDDLTPHGRFALDTCAFLYSEDIDPRITSKVLVQGKVKQQHTSIAELQTLSLVEVTRCGSMQMHRAIQKLTLQHCKDRSEVERRVSLCLLDMLDAVSREDATLMHNARAFHDRKQEKTELNRKIDLALIENCNKRLLCTEAIHIAKKQVKSSPTDQLSKEEVLRELLAQMESFGIEGQLDEARELFRKAMDTIEKHGGRNQSEEEKCVAFKIARLEYRQGNMEMAEQFIKKAVSESRLVHLTPKENLELMHIYGILIRDNFELRKKWFSEAIALATQIDVSMLYIGEILADYGEMLQGENRIPEAITEYKYVLNVFRQAQTDPIHAKLYRKLAECYPNNPDKKKKYLKNEIDFRKNHLPDDKFGLAESYYLLGALFLSKYMHTEAIEPLEIAEKLLPDKAKWISLKDAKKGLTKDEKKRKEKEWKLMEEVVLQLSIAYASINDERAHEYHRLVQKFKNESEEE